MLQETLLKRVGHCYLEIWYIAGSWVFSFSRPGYYSQQAESALTLELEYRVL